MRFFTITVENALGDRAEVPMKVREDRQPSQYAGFAIRRAALVIPNRKPLRVVSYFERTAP